MDETVDSFLKEINEIVPPKNVWEECYDEKSGFPYYWNTQTDEVTWEMPTGYKKQSSKSDLSKKKLYIPPPSEEKLMLGSIPHVNRNNVKIYKIDEITKPIPVPVVKNDNKSTNKKKTHHKRPSSDSEDEKIVLISSYGSESSSDEENITENSSNNKNKIHNSSYQKDVKSNATEVHAQNKQSPYNSEDESDILSQIQTKAKMLKQMGGELPESVKRLVSDAPDKKEVTGFSLLAGYGDDSEEETEFEEHPKKTLFPIEAAKPIATLFPIQNAPETFFESNSNEKPDVFPEENVDVKAFQRKRRIGVSLVNVQKKPIVDRDEKPAELERPGFGFKGGTNKEYPGFKSAGVIFAKSEEVVQPVENESDYVKVKDEKLLRDIEEFHHTLDEKLKFLCEGHSPALPVQVMIIQMDTLYTAMKEKCLKPTYLQKWLNNTCQDLAKLEEEAAPAGWLLHWDRTHKRYYYHNQTSGENQWEYPQPDIVSVDEAMDISTTPPPPMTVSEDNPVESMNLILPPPPPRIKEKSISPPPPPVISDYQLQENLNNAEPCPPGVDEAELDSVKEPTSETENRSDALTSELNSFYSDIATIESVKAPISESQPSEKDSTQTEGGPAKKKKKVKISQGLAMKKKGVSKLVEKWKNVQKTY